jgi:hypothetical protein
MARIRTVKKDGEAGERVLTNSDFRVLELIDFSYRYLRLIDDQIDVHKRFDKNDTEDRYGQNILTVYETGKKLFGGK